MDRLLVFQYLKDGAGNYLLDGTDNLIVNATSEYPVELSTAGIASHRGDLRAVNSFSVIANDAGDDWTLIINQYNLVGRFPSQATALGALVGCFIHAGATQDGLEFMISELVQDGLGQIDEDGDNLMSQKIKNGEFIGTLRNFNKDLWAGTTNSMQQDLLVVGNVTEQLLLADPLQTIVVPARYDTSYSFEVRTDKPLPNAISLPAEVIPALTNENLSFPKQTPLVGVAYEADFTVDGLDSRIPVNTVYTWSTSSDGGLNWTERQTGSSSSYTPPESYAGLRLRCEVELFYLDSTSTGITSSEATGVIGQIWTWTSDPGLFESTVGQTIQVTPTFDASFQSTGTGQGGSLIYQNEFMKNNATVQNNADAFYNFNGDPGTYTCEVTAIQAFNGQLYQSTQDAAPPVIIVEPPPSADVAEIRLFTGIGPSGTEVTNNPPANTQLYAYAYTDKGVLIDATVTWVGPTILAEVGSTAPADWTPLAFTGDGGTITEQQGSDPNERMYDERVIARFISPLFTDVENESSVSVFAYAGGVSAIDTENNTYTRNGVERVDFYINDGPAYSVTSTTIDAEGNEVYVCPFNPADITTDSRGFEVRAVVYPTLGKTRILQGPEFESNNGRIEGTPTTAELVAHAEEFNNRGVNLCRWTKQYYLDPVNGSDANDGLSSSTPKETMFSIVGASGELYFRNMKVYLMGTSFAGTRYLLGGSAPDGLPQYPADSTNGSVGVWPRGYSGSDVILPGKLIGTTQDQTIQSTGTSGATGKITGTIFDNLTITTETTDPSYLWQMKDPNYSSYFQIENCRTGYITDDNAAAAAAHFMDPNTTPINGQSALGTFVPSDNSAGGGAALCMFNCTAEWADWGLSINESVNCTVENGLTRDCMNARGLCVNATVKNVAEFVWPIGSIAYFNKASDQQILQDYNNGVLNSFYAETSYTVDASTGKPQGVDLSVVCVPNANDISNSASDFDFGAIPESDPLHDVHKDFTQIQIAVLGNGVIYRYLGTEDYQGLNASQGVFISNNNVIDVAGGDRPCRVFDCVFKDIVINNTILGQYGFTAGSWSSDLNDPAALAPGYVPPSTPAALDLVTHNVHIDSVTTPSARNSSKDDSDTYSFTRKNSFWWFGEDMDKDTGAIQPGVAQSTVQFSSGLVTNGQEFDDETIAIDAVSTVIPSWNTYNLNNLLYSNVPPVDYTTYADGEYYGTPPSTSSTMVTTTAPTTYFEITQVDSSSGNLRLRVNGGNWPPNDPSQYPAYLATWVDGLGWSILEWNGVTSSGNRYVLVDGYSFPSSGSYVVNDMGVIALTQYDGDVSVWEDFVSPSLADDWDTAAGLVGQYAGNSVGIGPDVSIDYNATPGVLDAYAQTGGNSIEPTQVGYSSTTAIAIDMSTTIDTTPFAAALPFCAYWNSTYGAWRKGTAQDRGAFKGDMVYDIGTFGFNEGDDFPAAVLLFDSDPGDVSGWRDYDGPTS